MRTASEYLRKYPNARPSTIVQRELKARRLSELQREINEVEIKKAAGIFYPLRRAVRRLLGWR